MQHWAAMIDFLSAAEAVYVFCGVIVAVFVIGLVDASWRLNSLRLHIRRATAAITPLEGTQGFYQQFEALGDRFARRRLLARPWDSFSKTVVLESTRDLVRITRRPQEFFNEASLLAPHINLRQLHAMPGYLISLGLFFTFVGLVAAIAVAAQGLGPGSDVAQTQAALVRLLDIASLKFVTSVTGISLSIVLSFLQKGWLNRTSNAIHHFCDAIEERTQLLTTEQLLYQWLIAQEQTTRSFAHLADDIAAEVTMQLKQDA